MIADSSTGGNDNPRDSGDASTFFRKETPIENDCPESPASLGLFARLAYHTPVSFARRIQSPVGNLSMNESNDTTERPLEAAGRIGC